MRFFPDYTHQAGNMMNGLSLFLWTSLRFHGSFGTDSLQQYGEQGQEGYLKGSRQAEILGGSCTYFAPAVMTAEPNKEVPVPGTYVCPWSIHASLSARIEQFAYGLSGSSTYDRRLFRLAAHPSTQASKYASA